MGARSAAKNPTSKHFGAGWSLVRRSNFKKSNSNIITIYLPMINTAPCIMFWMRAYPLLGQVGGGWTLEFESFLGPVKWHRADGECHFGPKKLDVLSLSSLIHAPHARAAYAPLHNTGPARDTSVRSDLSRTSLHLCLQ
jgi:hypothetical protein